MKQQEETLYLKMHKNVPKLQSHKTCDSSHQWTGNICKPKKLATKYQQPAPINEDGNE